MPLRLLVKRKKNLNNDLRSTVGEGMSKIKVPANTLADNVAKAFPGMLEYERFHANEMLCDEE